MSKPILGIDVSKESLDVQFVLENRNQYAVFSNNSAGHKRLIRWLKKRSKGVQVHVCMEATGMYAFPVAEQLHQASQYVSVVNPARIKAYADCQLARNKTDRLDAAIIADFCRTQTPSQWVPPRAEVHELQALVRLLKGLEEDRQAQVNRSECGVRSASVSQVLEDHIRYLDAQIKHVEQLIEDHVNQDPDLRHKTDLLVSIKGISSKTAHTILGEILYLDSFTDAKQVVAYAGLNPRQRLSGKMKGHSPISKTGNAHLRKALYFPAIVARIHNPIIREFCARLEANGLSKMEVVVAAMRKLLHIAFGVLKNDCPFDPDYEKSLQFLPVHP